MAEISYSRRNWNDYGYLVVLLKMKQKQANRMLLFSLFIFLIYFHWNSVLIYWRMVEVVNIVFFFNNTQVKVRYCLQLGSFWFVLDLCIYTRSLASAPSASSSHCLQSTDLHTHTHAHTNILIMHRFFAVEKHDLNMLYETNLQIRYTHF